MTAPETLVVVWTFADEDTTPATVLAHTPKSRDFQSGAPKWMDGERMVYVRRDPAVLARDETVLALVGAVIEEAANKVAPTRPRPCDCERCYCSNPGDAQDVADWDASQFNAEAVRALTPADAAAALAARDKRIRDEALEVVRRFVDPITAEDIEAAMKGDRP